MWGTVKPEHGLPHAHTERITQVWTRVPIMFEGKTSMSNDGCGLTI